MKKHIYIGTFPLGHLNVELYGLPDESNGYFFCRPDDRSPPRIKVGMDTNTWEECVSILLHETFEMLMASVRCRYETSGVRGDHASYTFIFTHTQFCDLCESQARFITPALPKLAIAWDKLRKKETK